MVEDPPNCLLVVTLLQVLLPQIIAHLQVDLQRAARASPICLHKLSLKCGSFTGSRSSASQLLG